MAFGLEVMGTGSSIRTSPSLAAGLDELTSLAATRKDMSRREVQHIEAIEQFARGNLKGATLIWEDILLDHPTDILALKLAQDTYFYRGAKLPLRDSVARVYPFWFPNNKETSTLPLSGYIHGIYAFGLEEARSYAEAERQALLGLSKIHQDGWASHALAHVYEMGGRSKEGLRFLSSTVRDWSQCNFLACHNFWHWALFHINEDEAEAACELFETEVYPRAIGSGAMLDIVDAASLLYRLDFVNDGSANWTTAEKWPKVDTLTKPHEGDRILGFNEAHFMMSCLGNNRLDDAQDLVNNLKVTIEADYGNEWLEVTRILLEAMIDFKHERYRETIDKLLPIRYDLQKLGGSDAQRDVFQLLLITAAAKVDKKLWQRLLIERKATKGQHDFLTKQWRQS